MKTLFVAPLILTLTAAFASGCASKSTSPSAGSGADAVDQGADANDTESRAESLTASLIGGGAGGLSMASAGELTFAPGDLTLDTLGDDAKALYRPAGCLVVTAGASSATYAFNDCTGPYGLVHITGAVDVSWSLSASPNAELAVSFSAKGLKLNGATIDWTAAATVTANGAARDMVWDGHFAGTTRHGRAIERTNHKEYKWTVGQACLSVQGTSDGTVTGHELKTEVINFAVCRGECPEAGSEIKITDVTANKTYDVKWNATDATYTGPSGASVTYTPACAL